MRSVMRCLYVLAASSVAVRSADQPVQRFVTQGKSTGATLFECPRVANARPTRVGVVTGTDGARWTVPAEVEFTNGPKAADLFNECNGVTPPSVDDARVRDVPVITVDPDGEVITGFLIADNYFELYVNGKLVAVDPVTFTPFNSVIVRFKARRPVTYAVRLVDWEEHLGVGTEQTFGGGAYHPGDGGFLASFSDGTVTDATWQAQSFYIAPLASPGEVIERGNVHDTKALGTVYPEAASQAACADKCFAVHYPIPKDWTAVAFDAKWPPAVEFTHAQMGTDRLEAYTRFREVFGEARPIWSSNLVYDNLVLARKRGR
jgi:hypothetical protein